MRTFSAVILLLFGVFCIALLQSCNPAPVKPVKLESLSQLEGKWKVISLQRGGEEKKDSKEILEIKKVGDKWEAIIVGEKREGFAQDFQVFLTLKGDILTLTKHGKPFAQIRVRLEGKKMYWQAINDTFSGVLEKIEESDH
jgi:hypothetical protein